MCGRNAQAKGNFALPPWQLLALTVLIRTLGGVIPLVAAQAPESASGYASSFLLEPWDTQAPDQGPTGGPALASTLERHLTLTGSGGAFSPDSAWSGPWSNGPLGPGSPQYAVVPQDLDGTDGLPEQDLGDGVELVGYASAATVAPSISPHRLTIISDALWGGDAVVGDAAAPVQFSADGRNLASTFPPDGSLMEVLAQRGNGSVFQNLLAVTGDALAPRLPLL